MLDVNEIPDVVLTYNLESLNLKENAISYQIIEQLGVYGAFNNYLTCLGVVGYTQDIIDALDGLRRAEMAYQEQNPT